MQIDNYTKLYAHHKDVHVNDLIRGEVIINSSILDDKVLYKSAELSTRLATTVKVKQFNQFVHWHHFLVIARIPSQQVIAGIEDFSIEGQEKIVMDWIAEKGYHTGNIMNAFRLTLVGDIDITSWSLPGFHPNKARKLITASGR